MTFIYWFIFLAVLLRTVHPLFILFDFVRQIDASIFITDKAEMNCFTGLALVKMETSDRPKINSMKSEQTDFKDEAKYQSKKKLFKQVFILQIQLKDYKNRTPRYQNEIKGVIEAIDELMGIMIE